jgi:ankyrin repeat protein
VASTPNVRPCLLIMNAATIPTLASTPSHQLEDETELVERNLDVLSISSSQDDTPVPSMAVTEETERDQTTNASKESRTLLLNYNRFHDTINNEDFDSVKEMLDDGANVERGTNGGVTPLIMAIYKSHIAIITLLLESGANVNAPFDDLTPIFHAVMQKERAPRIIQLLLDYGANLEAVAGPGNTNALHFAAANGMIHAADFLIDKGLHISRLCAAEQTPLIFAARHGHLAIVKLLLAKGADLHERSSRSATALMGAARHGQDEVVRYLLDAGARVDDRSEDGHSKSTYSGFFEQ